jgi:tRNA(fMet)-specific endonuclease VapC
LNYGKLHANLEKIFKPNGSLETKLGAHALNLNLTIITNNTQEFNRLEALR